MKTLSSTFRRSKKSSGEVCFLCRNICKYSFVNSFALSKLDKRNNIDIPAFLTRNANFQSPESIHFAFWLYALVIFCSNHFSEPAVMQSTWFWAFYNNRYITLQPTIPFLYQSFPIITIEKTWAFRARFVQKFFCFFYWSNFTQLVAVRKFTLCRFRHLYRFRQTVAEFGWVIQYLYTHTLCQLKVFLESDRQLWLESSIYLLIFGVISSCPCPSASRG